MAKAMINKDACIGCGVCEATCPVKAITITNGKASIDSNKCTGCGACVGVCPTSAINN